MSYPNFTATLTKCDNPNYHQNVVISFAAHVTAFRQIRWNHLVIA